MMKPSNPSTRTPCCSASSMTSSARSAATKVSPPRLITASGWREAKSSRMRLTRADCPLRSVGVETCARCRSRRNDGSAQGDGESVRTSFDTERPWRRPRVVITERAGMGRYRIGRSALAARLRRALPRRLKAVSQCPRPGSAWRRAVAIGGPGRGRSARRASCQSLNCWRRRLPAPKLLARCCAALPAARRLLHLTAPRPSTSSAAASRTEAGRIRRLVVHACRARRDRDQHVVESGQRARGRPRASVFGGWSLCKDCVDVRAHNAVRSCLGGNHD
jgi:hypothetical protein